MHNNKKPSSESTKKQKDSTKKEKKFIIPKETTNFLQNTLIEYKKVGKTNSYKITHKAKLIPYNDHTGLNLKEINVQPKDSWREGDRRLEKRMKKYIDTSIVESEKRMKQYIDTSIVESEKRMKQYIDTSIAESEKRMKKYIDEVVKDQNAKIEAMDQKIEQILQILKK